MIYMIMENNKCVENACNYSYFEHHLYVWSILFVYFIDFNCVTTVLTTKFSYKSISIIIRI